MSILTIVQGLIANLLITGSDSEKEAKLNKLAGGAPDEVKNQLREALGLPPSELNLAGTE